MPHHESVQLELQGQRAAVRSHSGKRGECGLSTCPVTLPDDQCLYVLWALRESCPFSQCSLRREMLSLYQKT